MSDDAPPFPLKTDVKGVFGKTKTGTATQRKGVRSLISVNDALTEKILRCAKNAPRDNPFRNQPWKNCPAWSSGETLRIGRVRKSGKRLYCALGNGAVSSTAPTHVTGSGIAPGGSGILLSFVGPERTFDDDPDAPSLSSSNTKPVSPLTCWWNPTGSEFRNKYRVIGGYPTYYQDTWIRPAAFTHKADGTRAAYGTAISFYTDAPTFAIQLNSNNIPVRFSIDGRFYCVDAYDPYTELNNNGGWVTFDFGAGQIKDRLIQIYANGPSAPYFGGVRTGDAFRVWRDERELVLAVNIGDSISQGSALGPFLPGGTITSRLGLALGWDIRNYSRGGTGWLAVGPDAVPDYTFRQRLPEALALNGGKGPEVINIFGGVNDLSAATGAVASEVTQSLQLIRNSGCEAFVFIFGVLPVNSGAVAGLDAAIGNAISSFADPLGRTRFCSLLNPGDGIPILTHNGNNSALNFSNTSTRYLSTNDGLHPTDYGTEGYFTAEEWFIRREFGLL